MQNYRQQLDHSLQREKDLEQLSIKLQSEVDDGAEFILSLEEKVYKANKITIELLKQLKDDEYEITDLKEHIRELRTKVPLYCAVKGDPIDRRLAEYINNYREKHKLKILFVRESEGIYLFGTKRTAIRVENDRITVRVGGGYLSIEEFLEQYTSVELQKIGRKQEHKKQTKENQCARESRENRNRSAARSRSDIKYSSKVDSMNSSQALIMLNEREINIDNNNARSTA